MKRLGLIVVGCLLVGCGTTSEPAATQPPSSVSPTPTAAPTVAAPAVPAVPHKDQPVFELTQDGTVYVFASVDAMTAFTGGQQQPTIVKKPNLTPSGKTVIFEATDDAQSDAMQASYNKLHPVAK